MKPVQSPKAAATMAVAKVNPNQAVGAVIDYGADTGRGFENQTRDDISIPFLAVLQSNSPQITNMEAAKPGMLFNTVTEELVRGDHGVTIVPATTRHVFVEWVSRDKGGGFVAMHAVESDVVKTARAASKAFGKYSTPAGNDLVETFYVYGMRLDAQQQPTEMVVIAFTSTKISVYKRYNTKISMFTVQGPDGRKGRPPLFAHTFTVKSTKERNNKGEFFNFDLQPAAGSVANSLLPPGHAALEAARGLKEMVDAGVAQADFASQAKASSGEDATGGSTDPDWNANP